MLEDALRSRYNVRSGGKKRWTIPDSALLVPGSKAGLGVGRGGDRGGTSKGKLDGRGRSERFSSQAKITAITAKSPGTFDLTVPSVTASSAGMGSRGCFLPR